MKALNKFNEIVSKLFMAIAGILLAVMVVVTFWQVVVRLTRGSLPWSEELARYMQIYLTFLGVSVGVKNKELVAVEALYELLPKVFQKLMDAIGYILVGIIMAILVFYGFKLVKMTLIQSSPVLGIKIGYIYFAIVFGSILMFIHNAINFLNFLVGYEDNTAQTIQSGVK